MGETTLLVGGRLKNTSWLFFSSTALLINPDHPLFYCSSEIVLGKIVQLLELIIGTSCDQIAHEQCLL